MKNKNLLFQLKNNQAGRIRLKDLIGDQEVLNWLTALLEGARIPGRKSSMEIPSS